MFLASALMLPLGISYASYGNSSTFTGTPTVTSHTPTTNQTMSNMTTHTPTTNQTMSNMTTPAPTNTPANNPSQSMSPLKQFKSGITAKSIECKSGFNLVLKAEDGSPACVHSSSVQILIQRGWAAIQ